MKKLSVIICEDETTGYYAYIPEIPGCASQGETILETLHNIADAAEGIEDVLRQDMVDPDTWDPLMKYLESLPKCETIDPDDVEPFI